jgi:hypothetical protein
MRRVRWGAALLAAALVIPTCEQLAREMRASSAAPTVTSPAAQPTAAPTVTSPAAQPTAAQPTAARPMTARPTTARPTTARPTTARPTAGEVGIGEPAATWAGTTSPVSERSAPAGSAGQAAPAPSLPSVTSAEWASGKFAGFTLAEAAEMAARCELRWQLPRVADDKYVAAVRALYVELTGDNDGAARLSLRALGDTLRVDSDDDAVAVHQRLAARRAGEAVEPSGSVYERYLQLQLDESERAHRDGSEPGAKLTLSGCDAGSALFRSSR